SGCESEESFIPASAQNGTAPSIEVVRPNSSETWQIGREEIIEWRSIDVPGDLRIDLYRRISYQDTLARRLYRSIERDDPSAEGAIAWTVQYDLAAGEGYFIIISSFEDPAVRDTSDLFVIEEGEGSYLHVVQPTKRARFVPGDELEIQWESRNVSGDVFIVLYSHYARQTYWLTSGTRNDGTYTWVIPDDVAFSDIYYIIIQSVRTVSVWDGSEYFSIGPTFTLSFPLRYNNWTPETAAITSVFDHSMEQRYCPDAL